MHGSCQRPDSAETPEVWPEAAAGGTCGSIELGLDHVNSMDVANPEPPSPKSLDKKSYPAIGTGLAKRSFRRWMHGDVGSVMAMHVDYGQYRPFLSPFRPFGILKLVGNVADKVAKQLPGYHRIDWMRLHIDLNARAVCGF